MKSFDIVVTSCHSFVEVYHCTLACETVMMSKSFQLQLLLESMIGFLIILPGADVLTSGDMPSIFVFEYKLFIAFLTHVLHEMFVKALLAFEAVFTYVTLCCT